MISPLGRNMIHLPAFLCAMILAGCGATPDPRFYTLSPIQTADLSNRTATTHDSCSVGIGPITIPDYLDRPQIAVRTSRNELRISEYNRWGGSLKSDISRVLAENLTALLSPDGISFVSWRQGVPMDYRVAIDLSRFEAVEGTFVILQAKWVIFAKEGNGLILLRDSTIREPIKGAGFDAAVAAMGKALETLSLNVADGVRRTLARTADTSFSKPGGGG